MFLEHNLSYSNKLLKVKAIYKFIFAMALLIISLISQSFILSISIFLAITIVNIYVSNSKICRYFKSLLIPIVFLLFSIITIIVSVSSSTEGFMTYISIGTLNIGVTYKGLDTSIKLFFRTMDCISAMYFIILTMPMDQIIAILKIFRLPDIFIELVVLVYRFIFIFVEESKEIYTAQYLRFGYRGLKKSYGSLAVLIKCLFLRVLRRYDDLTVILDTRLFKGKFYV